jgi:hypothetical protein
MNFVLALTPSLWGDQVPGPQTPRAKFAVRPLLQRAFEQAFLVVRSIEDPVERTEQLSRLGMAQTWHGQRDEARATLREALRAATTLKPDANYPIPHPIIRIAQAQAATGDPIAAHQTFQDAIRVFATESEKSSPRIGPTWCASSLRPGNPEPRWPIHSRRIGNSSSGTVQSRSIP